jgi:hypothetical protein
MMLSLLFVIAQGLIAERAQSPLGSLQEMFEPAAALANFDERMPLHAVETRKFKWRTQAALESKVEEIRQDILRRHAELIRMPMEAHLLTAEEAIPLPKSKIEMQFYNLHSKPKS